jgi:hypothetical protein
MADLDETTEEQALAGTLVLSVADAEALYARNGDSAAFEVLADAVNRAESDQRAAAEAAGA